MDSLYLLTPWKWKLIKKSMLFILKQNTISTILKLIITFLAAFSLYASTFYEAAPIFKVFVSIVAPLVFFIVASPAIRNYYHYKDFEGYWVYSNIPDYEDTSGCNPLDQEEDIDRFAVIYSDNGQLRIRASINAKLEGLLCDTPDTVLSGFGTLNGRLLYKYIAPQSASPKRHFTGFAILEWSKSDIANVVQEMSGRYYGHASKSSGALYFRRISKEEFERGPIQTDCPSIGLVKNAT